MNFRKLGVAVCMGALCWPAGCGKKQGRFSEEQMQSIPLANRYDLPAASGAMTMSLYSQTITSEEVLQAVEETLKPAATRLERQAFIGQSLPLIRQVIRSKAADILLYEQARKQAPSNIDEALEKAVEQEIKRFVASYGNNYALAEAGIRKMGMDWRTFREYQKKLILTHSYLSQKLNTPVRFTHRQLIEYYEAVKAEQFCRSGTLQFHAIEIIPDQLAADYIGDGQTAEQAAFELARSLATRAKADEDFEVLARTYSHGPLAKTGGKWLPVTIGAKALPEPYDILEKTALALQPGEVSEPVVHEGRIFIVRLDHKDLGGCKSFAEVQPLIEQQLEFQQRQKQYDEYISELMKQVDKVELEQFALFCAQAAYGRWHTAELE
ncbi:MAG: hypothetical protein GX298_05680 [Planctomycetes bacterium]|jgi:parvulin-like peptidyl-prolyl isomerase|nr:hypothetical protein [Planctomycetota bacterium]